MGLFDWGKKKMGKKADNENILASPSLIFKGQQGKGFKGFKKIHLVSHNSKDNTNYENSSKLYEKYGKEFVGAEITIEKINYDVFRGKRSYMLCVKVDDMPVGVIFDTSEQYNAIINGKIEKAYCRAEEETVVVKNDIVNRCKTTLLLKFI